MGMSLTSAEFLIVLDEAERGARRLVRTLGLPAHEWEDFRQDLLLDLLLRIKSFDPSRGRLGAFCGRIVSNRCARIAWRRKRDRRSLLFLATDDLELAALSSQPPNVADADRTIDIRRALERLSPAQRSVCVSLNEHSSGKSAAMADVSRATLYRHIHWIRLDLLMQGLSTAG